MKSFIEVHRIELPQEYLFKNHTLKFHLESIRTELIVSYGPNLDFPINFSEFSDLIHEKISENVDVNHLPSFIELNNGKKINVFEDYEFLKSVLQ